MPARRRQRCRARAPDACVALAGTVRALLPARPPARPPACDGVANPTPSHNLVNPVSPCGGGGGLHREQPDRKQGACFNRKSSFCELTGSGAEGCTAGSCGSATGLWVNLMYIITDSESPLRRLGGGGNGAVPAQLLAAVVGGPAPRPCWRFALCEAKARGFSQQKIGARSAIDQNLLTTRLE